jgi:hypothetical protein
MRNVDGGLEKQKISSTKLVLVHSANQEYLDSKTSQIAYRHEILEQIASQLELPYKQKQHPILTILEIPFTIIVFLFTLMFALFAVGLIITFLSEFPDNKLSIFEIIIVSMFLGMVALFGETLYFFLRRNIYKIIGSEKKIQSLYEKLNYHGNIVFGKISAIRHSEGYNIIEYEIIDTNTRHTYRTQFPINVKFDQYIRVLVWKKIHIPL